MWNVIINDFTWNLDSFMEAYWVFKIYESRTWNWVSYTSQCTKRLLSVQIIKNMLETLSMLIHSSESSTLVTLENLCFFFIYLWQEMLWTSIRLSIL